MRKIALFIMWRMSLKHLDTYMRLSKSQTITTILSSITIRHTTSPTTTSLGISLTPASSA